MNLLPFSILSWFVSIIYIVIFGCSIYAFLLFIKLARKGIKALDIYINENTKE